MKKQDIKRGLRQYIRELKRNAPRTELTKQVFAKFEETKKASENGKV